MSEEDNGSATATATKPKKGAKKSEKAEKAPKASREPKPPITKPVASRSPAKTSLPSSLLDDDMSQQVANCFKVLGDKTRVVFLQTIDGEKAVKDLVVELGLTQPALSHHIAILRHCGVVTGMRVGKENKYVLSPLGEKIKDVIGQLAEKLEEQA